MFLKPERTTPTYCCMYHNEIHKFVTGKARNFKFGTRVDLGYSPILRMTKMPKRGVVGSMGRILNFGPRHKCVNSEARNFKYGTQIDLSMS